MLQRNIEPPAGFDDPVAEVRLRTAQRTVDLREIGRILRRRWRLLAAVPAALAAAALVYSFVLATTQYTATSTVFVDPRRATAIESNQSAVQSSNYGTDDATIDSETQLIQSIAILGRVVDKLKLTSDVEFVPPPTLLDRVKQLFKASATTDGASAEDAQTAPA